MTYTLTFRHNGEPIREYHAHGDTAEIWERGIATLHRDAPETAGPGWEIVRQTDTFTAYAHKNDAGAVTDLYTLELTPRGE